MNPRPHAQKQRLSQLSIKTRIETQSLRLLCSELEDRLSQLSIKTRIETFPFRFISFQHLRLSQLSIKTRIETVMTARLEKEP